MLSKKFTLKIMRGYIPHDKFAVNNGYYNAKPSSLNQGALFLSHETKSPG